MNSALDSKWTKLEYEAPASEILSFSVEQPLLNFSNEHTEEEELF